MLNETNHVKEKAQKPSGMKSGTSVQILKTFKKMFIRGYEE